MTDEETEYFHQFYFRQRNRMRSFGQQWALSHSEWMQFWTKSPLAKLKMQRPKQVRLARSDKGKPWAVDNITAYVGTQKSAGIKPKRVPKPIDPNAPRLLTVNQWLEEIRR